MAQTTYSGNPFTSYSPFFSSGLLAQHTPRSQRRGTFNSDISEPWDDEISSPSRPSSPAPFPGDTVMDIDMSDFASTSSTMRNITPTPQSPTRPKEQTTPVQLHRAQSTSNQSLAQQQPRLRRRRSSLTQATSPMTVIRSPSRSAGNALHLQMQLPGRSRSGSVSDDALGMYGVSGIGMATEGTSLVGRMRSGSRSSVNSLPLPGSTAAGPIAPVAFRPRRVVRRIPSTAMPALRAPPPTAPLPALPLPVPSGTDHFSQQKLRPSNLNLKSAAQGSSAGLKSPTLKSPTLTSARARGLSVSSSALDGDENRIDEEMKEN